MKRRTLMGLAAGATLGGSLLSGCKSDDGPGEDGRSKIRFSWWGSAPRHEATHAMLKDFSSKFPIDVETETGDFTDYWTRLATQFAGSDAPDAFANEERYVAEYGKRGALLDLREAPGLDLSKFPEDALGTGTVEGTLYALPTGQNAYQVMANKTMFDDLGIDLPDDTTWTWDDYLALAKEITEKSGGDILGTDYGTGQDADLQVWLRQFGEMLFAEDGSLACTPQTTATWFEHILEISDSGAGLSAAQYQEALTANTEQLPFAVKQTALSWWWTNHFATVHTLTENDVVMLRVPSQNGQVTENGMFLKSSMFWSINARSKQIEEASTLVNYLANDTDAASFMLVDRGVPVNPDTLAAIKSDLGEHDQTVIDYLDQLRTEIKPSPPPPPPGAGAAQQIIKRYLGEVLFKQRTPAEAADAMLKEVDDATD